MDQTNKTFTSNLERLNVGGALRRQLETHLPDNVIWEIKPDGNPVLNINGKKVYQDEAAVATVAREINAFLENQNPDLIVFFGLGLGLHLQFLRLKTQKPILVFEPSLDVLASVLPCINLDVKNVTLITNTGHLIEAAGEILSKAQDKLAVGAIIPYREIFPEDFQNFYTALQQSVRNITIHQSTRSNFAHEWIEQIGSNLPTLIHAAPLHALGDVFKGKVGIVVGAGPSLDQNIDVLKKAQGRALICAVHTAVMPLAKAGIIPDIVVLIESQELNRYFIDVQNMDQMILAPAPHVHPEQLKMGFKGFFNLSIGGQATADWYDKAYGIAPLKSGGSVACTAFSILHTLQCDPIALVGMDTAFTNNRTHALDAQTGCCEVKKDPETNTMSYTYTDGREIDGQWDSHMVQAWGGEGQVMTRPLFSSFRHWFEGAGQTWASDRTLISATEGGARFHGFLEMRLADVLEQYAPEQLPITSWLEGALAMKDLLDPKLLAEEIHRELDTVAQAQATARRAETEATLALKKLKSRQLGTLQPVLDNLSTQETELQRLTLQTRLINSLIGHKAMDLSAEKPAGNDKISMTIHSVEISRKISRLIIKASDELKETFTPVIAELTRAIH